jgi:hypothetical protein
MAARSKARTVFDRSNSAIVGSNPSRGMDVCVCARARDRLRSSALFFPV